MNLYDTMNTYRSNHGRHMSRRVRLGRMVRQSQWVVLGVGVGVGLLVLGFAIVVGIPMLEGVSQIQQAVGQQGQPAIDGLVGQVSALPRQITIALFTVAGITGIVIGALQLTALWLSVEDPDSEETDA